MAAHSHIGASSMHRWAACPGSVRLCQDIPNTTSKYAAEGTQAHELAAAILGSRLGKKVEASKPLPDLIADAPEDMQEAVDVYVELVLNEISSSSRVEVLIEHRFDLSSLHPGLFGTADCVIYYPKRGLLQVWDYKHGAGVAVDAEGNEQLQYYGLGALLSSGKPCKEVELIIVQPRNMQGGKPDRRWKIPAAQLIDFEADLVEAAKRTEDPNAPLVPGADQCKFCAAKGTCPALREQAVVTAQKEFSAGVPYDPQDLADTLAKLDIVEEWAKGVRAFAYAEAEHGRCPPGWKLVAKRASRKWRNAQEVEQLLTSMADNSELLQTKLDQCLTKPELKSPTQVEKALGKEHKKLIADMTVSISSGFALAPESDPRPAAKMDAATEFAEAEDNIFD